MSTCKQTQAIALQRPALPDCAYEGLDKSTLNQLNANFLNSGSIEDSGANVEHTAS